jgi:hypothetical protein
MNDINKFLILLPLILLFSGCTGNSPSNQASQDKTQVETSTVASTTPFSYEDYDTVLKTYVNNIGLVDYSSLQANRQLLAQFNAAVGALTPETYQSWSENEQIAFLINAYNSFTLQSIIDQNPLKKSIRDIPGVWEGRKFQLAGQSKTLDDIEHKTLRVDFNEPRIHVALVCAAISCPPLRNEAYTPENLDAQLDDQVRRFIASSQGFRLERQKNRVYLSSIFKWYGQDWQKSYGVDGKFAGNAKERAVLNFLSQYLDGQDKLYLEQGGYQISYLDYDWSLNKQ